MSNADVRFEDYEKDTRELTDLAASVIKDLRRQIRDRDILIWAMVRSSGGSLLVYNHDIAIGHPETWLVEEDLAQNGRRFTITRKAQ